MRTGQHCISLLNCFHLHKHTTLLVCYNLLQMYVQVHPYIYCQPYLNDMIAFINIYKLFLYCSFTSFINCEKVLSCAPPTLPSPAVAIFFSIFWGWIRIIRCQHSCCKLLHVFNSTLLVGDSHNSKLIHSRKGAVEQLNLLHIGK